MVGNLIRGIPKSWFPTNILIYFIPILLGFSIFNWILKLDILTKAISERKSFLRSTDRNYFSVRTSRIMKKVLQNHLTQEKHRIIVIMVYNDQDSLFLFQVIPCVSTTFRAQPLQNPYSSPKFNLLWKKKRTQLAKTPENPACPFDKEKSVLIQ